MRTPPSPPTRYISQYTLTQRILDSLDNWEISWSFSSRCPLLCCLGVGDTFPFISSSRSPTCPGNFFTSASGPPKPGSSQLRPQNFSFLLSSLEGLLASSSLKVREV